MKLKYYEPTWDDFVTTLYNKFKHHHVQLALKKLSESSRQKLIRYNIMPRSIDLLIKGKIDELEQLPTPKRMRRRGPRTIIA